MNTVCRVLVMLFLLLVATTPTAYAAPSTSTAAQAQLAAKLTEAKGTVYKRGFIDWNREQWGEPAVAKAGDALLEGMQVGTGDNSWAQISWTHIKTRAWANSVYAIAPNQRLVYLIGGEMLFQLDKNRKDKREYHVWTNLLHARIRGTTVLVQSTGEVSRVTCLEGHIDVTNRTDNSVIHLKPGAVYEIKSNAVPGATENDAATIVAKPTALLSNLAPIMAAETARPVFQTSKTTSTVYLVDKQTILQHPLLTNFESPLPSLPLITDTLGSLGLPDLIGNLVPNTLKSVLNHAFEIAALPSRLNYLIGPDAGSLISINRQSLALFPPDGGLNLPVNALNLTSRTNTGLAPQILPLGSFTNANLSTTTAQTLTGVTSLAGVSSITGASGSLSAVTGAATSVNSLTSSLSSITSSVSSSVTSTTSQLGLGGTISGTVGSTLGSVTGVATGALGTVGGALSGGTGGGGGGSGGGLLGLPLGGGGGLGGLGGLLGR